MMTLWRIQAVRLLLLLAGTVEERVEDKDAFAICLKTD